MLLVLDADVVQKARKQSRVIQSDSGVAVAGLLNFGTNIP